MSDHHTQSRQAATADSRRLSARDAGLALAARANRWMISGAVILAGGLTAVTAHAFHPGSAAAVHALTPAATPAVPAHGSEQDNSGAPLQAPSTPPASAAPTPSPAPVVSGGS
jgi:hypothetical protein